MSDDPRKPGPFRVWFGLRRAVVLHPRQARQELTTLTNGTPWYATARPFALIQHWAPDLFTPLTYCGRWADERSSGEIRTALGWHCRKCHRRAKRAMRAVAAAFPTEPPADDPKGQR